MTTAYTSLLGLALPVTGELSGTWGDTVNNSITSLLDSAIAGTTTISSDADVTLTTTTGAANTSRQVILLWTAGGTVTRTITAPAQSKTYIVINKTSSSQSIKIVGAGPTTGVTIVAGTAAFVVWNGVDFVTASVTSTTGVLPVANGGTGVTTSTGTGNTVLSAAPTLSGNVTLSTGNLIVASGQGIDFSATAGTGTSELLADYEEGTWTIGIAFGGGTTGITYVVNTGRYIKIGKSVTVTGLLLLSNKGSSAGVATLTGLPYTIGAGNASQSAAAIRIGNTTFVGQYQAVGSVGTTVVDFGADSELGVPSSLTNANFANNSIIQISYTYFVD